MSENRMNVFLAIIGCLAFLSIPSCVVVQNNADNAAVVEMVKHGANPIEAACAVRSGNTQNCLVSIAKR